MTRRKAPAIEVPASTADAAALLAFYVGWERQQLKTELHYQVEIDKLKTERDLIVAQIRDNQKGAFASLKAWWEAGGNALAGKARSAEFAGAKIGIRRTTPKVKFLRGAKAETIVAWLGRVVGGAAFLRTKIELDKEAVIKALRSAAPMAGPLTEQGVLVDQTDEFFIDAGLDPEAIRAELTQVSSTE